MSKKGDPNVREFLTARADSIHKYWARKPGALIANLISRYSEHGDTVLDPFMGSGSTGVQALSLNRQFIGNDLNPFSHFLVEVMLQSDFSRDDFDSIFLKFEKLAKSKVMNLYLTEEGDYGQWSLPDYPGGIGMVTDFNLGNKRTCPFKYVSSPAEGSVTKHPRLTTPFPSKFYKDRISKRGIKSVDGLYTARNQLALSILLETIDKFHGHEAKILSLALTNSSLHLSKLKSKDIRPLSVNNYWIPKDPIEENAWWRFSERFRKVKDAVLAVQKLKLLNTELPAKAIVQLGSATNLVGVSDESVDYVFTDPPYGDAIQYSELSHIWNSLLGLEFISGEEVIVNPTQGKGNAEYLGLLAGSLSEIGRVLKRDSFMTLAFHSKDINLWVGLAETLRKSGFSLVEIFCEKPKGSPFTRNWAKFSPKNDFYITLRNSKIEIETESELVFADYLEQFNKNFDKSSFESINDAYDAFASTCMKDVLGGLNLEVIPTKAKFVKRFQDLYG